MAIRAETAPASAIDRDSVLREIQDRVLWLAVYMVDYANNERPSTGDLKIGGHQASSSSVVTVLTYLFFEYMRAGDRIAIKPHASPVYHAIQYLLGNLAPEYLQSLRWLHGLQAYPSRTKDPDSVDFSAGPVGLGAVAPNFASLTETYARARLEPETRVDRRYISLLGDAELDEGVVWEAIADHAVAEAENILWVIDLNRQSLDRVIPGIRVRVWREMFAANGWTVIDAKYGKKLQAAFHEPNGELLRAAIDDMSNDMYQRLLRVDAPVVREWMPRVSRYPDDLRRLLSRWDDARLEDLLTNLGGHDFAELRDAFGRVDLAAGPNILFAYTLKGWKLPFIGDPRNHAVTMNKAQMEELRVDLGIDRSDVTARLDPLSAAGRAASEAAERLQVGVETSRSVPALDIPDGFDRGYRGAMSSQQIFGLVLTDIARNIPDVSERVVTVSPDVASSTNLGGWINKVGVWSRDEREELPEHDGARALQWVESDKGQHIELGISENNLFMMLGQLGVSYEMNGELLFPIGTLYDPFLRRGLDALVYSAYSGGRFIIVGTPSGLTLGPEGGSHQSLVTSSIGAELPETAFYEPAFGQELEWILLDALRRILRREESTYLRLTTRRVDQGLFTSPSTPEERERLRRQVLDGAYKLVDRGGEPEYGRGYNIVNVMACGAMVPEAVEASNRLLAEGVFANVINVTGPGPLYRRFQESVRASMRGEGDVQPFLEDVITIRERTAPIVTVVDAHSHSLAWIGAAMKTVTFPLGVHQFGQSGSPADLYREYEIDVDSIMAACYGALGM